MLMYIILQTNLCYYLAIYLLLVLKLLIMSPLSRQCVWMTVGRKLYSQITACTHPQFATCKNITHQFSHLYVLSNEELTGHTSARPFRIKTGNTPPVKLCLYRMPSVRGNGAVKQNGEPRDNIAFAIRLVVAPSCGVTERRDAKVKR